MWGFVFGELPELNRTSWQQGSSEQSSSTFVSLAFYTDATSIMTNSSLAVKGPTMLTGIQSEGS